MPSFPPLTQLLQGFNPGLDPRGFRAMISMGFPGVLGPPAPFVTNQAAQSNPASQPLAATTGRG
jgi:hypothetical protein